MTRCHRQTDVYHITSRALSSRSGRIKSGWEFAHGFWLPVDHAFIDSQPVLGHLFIGCRLGESQMIKDNRSPMDQVLPV
jgi:hypothetical protein